MHFFFPGRMMVEEIAFEAKRIAELLHNNGVDSVYSAMLRVKLISKHQEVTFFNDITSVEAMEVPPFRASLALDPALKDCFVKEMFSLKCKPPLAINGSHEKAMWTMTGDARGPASIERLAASGLAI